MILAFPANSILDSTAAGRSLLTSANTAGQRSLLGLGTTDSPTFAGLTAGTNFTIDATGNVSFAGSSSIQINRTNDAVGNNSINLANAFGLQITATNSNLQINRRTGGVWSNVLTFANSDGAAALSSTLSVTTNNVLQALRIQNSGNSVNSGWELCVGSVGNYEGHLFIRRVGQSSPGDFYIAPTGEVNFSSGLTVQDGLRLGSSSSSALAFYSPYTNAAGNSAAIYFRNFSTNAGLFEFAGYYNNGSWNLINNILALRTNSATDARVGIGTNNPSGKFAVADTVLSGSGSLAGSLVDLTQTWNTSGTPTAINLNVTDTASVGGNLITLRVGGSNRFSVDKGGIVLASSTIVSAGSLQSTAGNVYTQAAAGAIGWQPGGNWDLLLLRDAANILALRNGVIAQAFRVYNTFTDASNYERAKIAWESNVLRISTESAGTGSARGLEIQTNGLTQLTIAANGITTFTNGLFFGNSANSANNASASGTGNETVFACSQTYNATAGSRTIFAATNSFQPTSGTLTYAGVGISPTINQTGGANGITRGLHINPTLTSAADFRAIEVTAGKTILAASTTGATSLQIPSGSNPTSPNNGDIWFDGTNLKIRIGGVTRTVNVT